jgi:hypothetical protein
MDAYFKSSGLFVIEKKRAELANAAATNKGILNIYFFFS